MKKKFLSVLLVVSIVFTFLFAPNVYAENGGTELTNDVDYRLAVYKVMNGAPQPLVVWTPSQSATAADAHFVNLPAGQYYFQVYVSEPSTSYGSNYILALNAQYPDIYRLLHHGEDLQNLVYLTFAQGPVYIDGGLLGPHSIHRRHEANLGPNGNYVYELSIIAYDSIPSTATGVSPNRTIKVRVCDVRYRAYYSVVNSGHVSPNGDTEQFDTEKRGPDPEDQPEMWMTFNVDTGECINFSITGWDRFDLMNPFGLNY